MASIHPSGHDDPDGGDYLFDSPQPTSNSKQENVELGVKFGLPPLASEDEPTKSGIRKAHEVLTGIRRLTMIEEPTEEQEQLAFQLQKGMKLKGLISDKKFRLKTYQKCFIASECIDFMIQTKMVKTRQEGIELGQELEERLELFHHVTNEHEFDDEYLFFRFEDDEDNLDGDGITGVQDTILGTITSTVSASATNTTTTSQRRAKRQSRMSLQSQAQALSSGILPKSTGKRGLDYKASIALTGDEFPHARLANIAENVKMCLEVKDRDFRFTTYPQCFIASEAIDIMVENHLVESREEAVFVGRLLESKLYLWHHVTCQHPFDDEYLFFRFTKIRGSCSDITNDVLLQICYDLKSKIPVEDHTYMMKKYKNCFVAGLVVTYLVKTRIVETREDAVWLGQLLQTKFKLWRRVSKKQIHNNVIGSTTKYLKHGKNLMHHTAQSSSTSKANSEPKLFRDEYLFFRFTPDGPFLPPVLDNETSNNSIAMSYSSDEYSDDE